MTLALPPPPSNKHPIATGEDNIITDEYARWFQSIWNIFQQAAISAPSSANYIIQTSNILLTQAQVLANLPTGFIKVTTGSGILTSTSHSTIQTSDLSTTGISAGNYGSSSQVPSFTVGLDGRLTTASNITITGTTPGGNAGGDLSGAYPNPTVIGVGNVTTGTLGVGNGGTGQSSYTDGQLLIGKTSGNTLNKATLTAGTGVTITNGSGTITIAATGTTLVAPTVQKFTSSTGTYTTPANVLYLKVKMVGGGGGGGGSSTSGANNGGTGGTGGNTTFGTSLLVANGGVGGAGTSQSAGGTGGTASLGSGPIGTALQGATGSSAQEGQGVFAGFECGGDGAQSPLGGRGQGAVDNNTVGGAGITNSGSGGGGAGSPSGGIAGKGGGAGGWVEAIITSPSATYSYAVGAAGSAGTAGTSGSNGGAGGSGYIIVWEYYQ